MKKLAIGVAVATVAMYAWGFLFWGVLGLPYSSWKTTEDDAEVGRVLTQMFPESGSYFVPAMGGDAERRKVLFERGPIAFVHISIDGSSEMNPKIMVMGFLVSLAAVVFLALMLRTARLPTYMERLKVVALGGIAVVILLELGDVVWWYEAMGWKLWMAFYNVVAIGIAGAVLAKFMEEEGLEDTEETEDTEEE